MAQKYYKECQVCGKLYEACPFCDSQNEFYAWRSVVCCEEHMTYHIPIISYIRKVISKEQAKKDLALTSQPKTDNAQVKTKTSSVRKTKK